MAQHEPATVDQLAERHEIIRNLITQGKTQAEIVRTVREEYSAWGIVDRTVRNYVKAVYETLSADAVGVDRAAYFMRTIERLDYVYGKAIEAGNLKVAHDTQVSLAKLLRLETPQAAFDWRKAAQEAGLDVNLLVQRAANRYKQVVDETLQ